MRYITVPSLDGSDYLFGDQFHPDQIKVALSDRPKLLCEQHN